MRRPHRKLELLSPPKTAFDTPSAQEFATRVERGEASYDRPDKRLPLHPSELIDERRRNAQPLRRAYKRQHMRRLRAEAKARQASQRAAAEALVRARALELGIELGKKQP